VRRPLSLDYFLEADAKSDLDLAFSVQLQSGDSPKGSVIKVAVGLVELRSVENVKEISAEPDPNSLGYGEILADV
jgi:hypothetical protein